MFEKGERVTRYGKSVQYSCLLNVLGDWESN